MRAPLHLLAVAGLALLASPAAAVTIDTVPVGDPGNAPDAAANCYQASCGSVADTYFIATYEVTNAQYAEFLNSKAASDPLALYSASMASSAVGGITRSGSDGSYTYSVKPGYADKPVAYVSFYDALRFTNWLNNGQGGADTETGAYTLLGGTAVPSNGATVTRNAGALVFLPTENEWYKAAYYDGLSATYFDFPAGSNAATACVAPTGAANSANCNMAVGNVTDVGSYPGSAGPYGTFDQGGNLFEWTETIQGTSRAVRGGAWTSVGTLLGASARVATAPTSEGNSVGFRVATIVPEPGTVLLVAAGLAGLGARRLAR
jgi:formylglycine-generating enzyme required for sulfatase activity